MLGFLVSVMKRDVRWLAEVVCDSRVTRESEKIVGMMRRKDLRNIEDAIVCLLGELIKEMHRVLEDKKTKDE